jgi:nitroreductase
MSFDVNVNLELQLRVRLCEARQILEIFMEVSQAVAARRSVRGFLDTPIDLDLVQRLVIAASRAPSGGNLQPWHVDIVAGEAMNRLKQTMMAKLAGGPETPEYDIYPKELVSPYRDRRFAVGEAMYERIGIPRDDKIARRMWFARNFAFFGAPVALFMTVDKRMGPPQWSDLGMFLQTFMLLAVDAGLATCAQECWAVYPETVRTFLNMPDERMLFCGMAIGHEDTTEPANALCVDRAPSSEWLTIKTD